jgi:hypothetical protein
VVEADGAVAGDGELELEQLLHPLPATPPHASRSRRYALLISSQRVSFAGFQFAPETFDRVA